MQPDLSSFLGEGADRGAWEEGGLMIGVKERESKRGNEISRFGFCFFFNTSEFQGVLM